MMPKFTRFDGARDGVSFVEADGDALAEEIRRVALDLGILDGGALVVTATNDGDAGVHALNETLHERHMERTGIDEM